MKLYCSILFVAVCVWQTAEAQTKVPPGLQGRLSEDELDHVLEIQKNIAASHPEYANDKQLSIKDIKKGLSIYFIKNGIVSPDVDAQQFGHVCQRLIVEPCKKVREALDYVPAGALAFRLYFCKLIAQDEDLWVEGFCSSVHNLMTTPSKLGPN